MHVVQRDRMDQDASSGYLRWGSIGWMVDDDGAAVTQRITA